MHQVSYTSTRGEIWRWYWRAWARPFGLWRFHALIGLALAAAWANRSPATPFDFSRFASTLGLTIAACLLLFPLWPHLRFKPQRRVLTIDSKGWTTQIGDLQGSRAWGAVRSIKNSSDGITFVSSNGNALIIPNRAFPDQSAREAFLNDARRWHAGVAA